MRPSVLKFLRKFCDYCGDEAFVTSVDDRIVDIRTAQSFLQLEGERVPLRSAFQGVGFRLQLVDVPFGGRIMSPERMLC